jgi:hypothetical protein
MNGFLVVLECYFDTKPVRLFATRAEAVAFARRVRESGEDPHPTKPGCLGSPGLREVLLAVSVIEFVGGAPGKKTPVQVFAARRRAAHDKAPGGESPPGA